MQTASIVLSKHPNKANIEVKLDPWMRETFRWASSIPQPYKDICEQANKLFAGFKAVDFSALESLISNCEDED